MLTLTVKGVDLLFLVHHFIGTLTNLCMYQALGLATLFPQWLCA